MDGGTGGAFSLAGRAGRAGTGRIGSRSARPGRTAGEERPCGRPFRDRAEAGRVLAEKLADYAGRDDVIVLALPRGGVPVAYEVARALRAPLDVFLVRKLGARATRSWPWARSPRAASS